MRNHSATGGRGTITDLEKDFAIEEYELNRLLKKIKGTVPDTAFRSTEEVFSPSRLSAGGDYSKQSKRPRFDYNEASRQQIEKIKEGMTGVKDENEYMVMYAKLGDAIHAKLERELEKRGNIKTEVYGEMEDVVGGILAGTADIVEYDSPKRKKIELIGDIKTVSSRFIEELDKKGGKQRVLNYEDIKDKLTGELATKIENAVSQLNTYLKIFEDKLSGNAKAEIRFYDRADLGSDVEKYKAVRFIFDEKRLHKDMQAVFVAREELRKKDKSSFVKIASTGKAKGASATDEDIQQAIALASKKIKRKPPTSYQTRDPEKGPDKFSIDPKEAVERFGKKFSTKEELDRYLMPTPIAEGAGTGPLFENLKTMHDQAMLYQSRKGINADILSKMPSKVGGLIEEAETTGADYQKFIDLIDKLREIDPTGKQGGISGMDVIKAWKLYRLAVGEFLIKHAEAAKKEMEELQESGDQRGANEAYGRYQKRVDTLQDTIRRSVGKRTDVYTDDRRFITPGLARAAGIYKTPEQIIKESSEPFLN